MTATPRQREEAAIATLVALHLPNGPDEWLPGHFATAEQAALVAAEYVRRTGRAVGANRAAPAPQRRTQARKGDIPTLIRDVVLRRSGGDCEARTDACTLLAQHVHHIAGRGGPAPHRLDNLLHVCQSCHDWIHAHPGQSYRAGWMVKRLGVDG